MDLEVIDTLDTAYHICGTKVTHICLMSDGSVRAVQETISEEYLGELEDCPF